MGMVCWTYPPTAALLYEFYMKVYILTDTDHARMLFDYAGIA